MKMAELLPLKMYPFMVNFNIRKLLEIFQFRLMHVLVV